MTFENTPWACLRGVSHREAARSLALSLAGLAYFLCGCRGSPASPETAIARLTPEVIRIGVTAEAEPSRAGIQACRDDSGSILLVEEITGSSEAAEEFDIIITLGPPSGDTPFMTAIAEENLIVVAADERETDLGLMTEALRAIYSGRARSWSEVPDGGRFGSGQISLWNYPAGHPLRIVFEAALWDQTIEFPPLASLAPDPQKMGEAVAAEAGRIGYIPAAWKIPGLGEIELEPDLRERLRLPLIASSGEEFTGAVRSLLACMQSGSGHDALMELYSPWG